MWYQYLHRMVHGLVAVMVVVGSLALLSCGNDETADVQTQTVRLDAATTRTNVDSNTVGLLAARSSQVDNRGVPVGIDIDVAAFAFATVLAPGTSVKLVISNVRAIAWGAIVPGTLPAPGNISTSPRVLPTTPYPPLPTAVSVAAGIIQEACPRVALAANQVQQPQDFALTQVVANPIAAADYTITEDDGTVIVNGTLCIGAGTTGVVALNTPAPQTPFTLGVGGNICIFTNSEGSALPGVQSVYTTCKIVVSTKTGTGGEPGVPIGGTIAGNLQLQLTPATLAAATVLSQAIEVTIRLTDNGNNTGNIFVDGFDTGIGVVF